MIRLWFLPKMMIFGNKRIEKKQPLIILDFQPFSRLNSGKNHLLQTVRTMTSKCLLKPNKKIVRCKSFWKFFFVFENQNFTKREVPKIFWQIILFFNPFSPRALQRCQKIIEFWHTKLAFKIAISRGRPLGKIEYGDVLLARVPF